MSNYEVRITKNGSSKFNVDLISFDKSGFGMSSNRAFNVSKKVALEVAKKSASLYGAEIINNA